MSECVASDFPVVSGECVSVERVCFWIVLLVDSCLGELEDMPV